MNKINHMFWPFFIIASKSSLKKDFLWATVAQQNNVITEFCKFRIRCKCHGKQGNTFLTSFHIADFILELLFMHFIKCVGGISGRKFCLTVPRSDPIWSDSTLDPLARGDEISQGWGKEKYGQFHFELNSGVHFFIQGFYSFWPALERHRHRKHRRLGTITSNVLWRA